MLVLFESAAGYAIFKLADEKKLRETENLFLDFETPEQANKIVKLKHFEKFNDMIEAVSAATALNEGKLDERLKMVLEKIGTKNQLAVADAKLGNIIKEELKISCVNTTAIQELMRCIRSQMDSLISGLPKKEMAAMALGLAHSLSRYQLKFSPDKVDTMIIQAISLLEDLDKELNNYIMRCKEWYGWHFPELSKVITDNTVYVKTVQRIGLRNNVARIDLSDLLLEDIEQKVKELAEISMGTEISDDDMNNINHLCKEIIEMQAYRTQLFEYLRNRMMAIAPNLTVLVGEMVGAKLISRAGSLLNLAKYPASTVQILGAEKALFRALKTKHDTPKYGVIYHTAFVGQSASKLKGKASRMLAAKSSLAVRVDALGEDGGFELGAEHKSKLESRLKLLEEGGLRRISGTGKKLQKLDKYENKSEIFEYKAAQDSTLPSSTQKRKFEADEDDANYGAKKIKVEVKQECTLEENDADMPKSGKKKKRKSGVVEEPKALPEEPLDSSVLSKKKKKKQKQLEASIKTEPEDESFGTLEENDADMPKSGKKKKRKSLIEEVEEPKASPEEPLDSSVLSKKKKKKQKQLEASIKTEPEDESFDTLEENNADMPKSEKKKKRKSEVVEEPKALPEEPLDSSVVSKKKKKRQKQLEASIKTEPEDESFESSVVSKKKKKKEKQLGTSIETKPEDESFVIDTNAFIPLESGKKKKDKHNVTDEGMPEGLSKKKKKRKHADD